MTQEEKARAYDEALERAKEQIEECGDNEGRKKMIRNIFPELHESEDEKTRKALIQFLNDIKSISESSRTSWAIRKEDAEMCNGFITYLEKRKEQKSVEWNEEDNIGWDEAFACVTRAEKAAKNEEELQNAVTAEKWLKEIKFKYCVHPVKQEWSEEDESELTAVIYCVSRAIKASKDENERNSLLSAKKWLQDKLSFRVKSLRPSCKPVEWSEEDEDYMNAIITIINRETALYPKGGATEDLNNDLIAWLKSRCPNKQD